MTPGAGCTWSPSWVVESTDGTVLVVAAGADRRIAVDGLSAATLVAVRSWEASAVVAETSEERQLLDRLVEIGAVVPVVGTRGAVSLIGAADVGAGALEGLATRLQELGLEVVDQPAPDHLAVVVRTGSRWPDPPTGTPHLGVDLTLHHTIVLGPFVVPGVSACLACGVVRTTHRWGEAPVAPRPGVVRSLAVVAALLVVQLELVWQGTSPLVNATVAWDLERGTTDHQSLYKMVGCTSCDVVGRSSRVTLPWDHRGGAA